MAKLIIVAAAAVLLFFTGLFAGRVVPRNSALAAGRGHSMRLMSAGASGGPADPQVHSTASSGSNPFSFTSSTPVLQQPEVCSVEAKAQTSGSPGNERSPDERHTAIRKLIQRQFPDTDAEVAEIWAETFGEMDPDEIRFILEQKRRISTELGSAVTLPPLYPSPVPIAEPLNSTPESAINASVRMVQRNLQSAWSLGYCRMAVYLEAINDPQLLSADETCHLPVTSFRCFESGALIQSPIPTHVALTKSNSTMFRMDAGRLTRRGDFCLLSSRRLGIVTREGELACAESLPIPEEAINIRVSKNGLVQYQNAAGETCEAGRISVCSVTNPAELQSEDGVIFKSQSADNPVLQVDYADLLQPNALEQSNVDQTYESLLLTHLKSMSQTSF